MKEKIKNIAMLNDKDMNSYSIEGLMEETDQIGINKDANLSELDKLFLRINVLNIKKERLLQDLKETEDEIKTLEILLESSIA